MRALILDKNTTDIIDRVVHYAKIPENYWRPLKDQIPGNDPRYVINIPVGYRCVFTITKSNDGNLYRQLSISVDAPGKLPNIPSVEELMKLFGFEGNINEQWNVSLDPGGDAIRVTAEYKP